MSVRVLWDRPRREHGEAPWDFAAIAADVQPRDLPKPVSSGNRQTTIRRPVPNRSARGRSM